MNNWSSCRARYFFNYQQPHRVITEEELLVKEEPVKVRKAELHKKISETEIATSVRTIAEEILFDYQPMLDRGEELILLVNLKGAVIFFADLFMMLPDCYNITPEFVQTTSYSDEVSPAQKVKLVHGLEHRHNLKGNAVIIIEDIVDTGKTAKFLINYLRGLGVGEISLCALLDKQYNRVEDVVVNYRGFRFGLSEDEFIVGYGLGLGDKYRNYADLCSYHDNK